MTALNIVNTSMKREPLHFKGGDIYVGRSTANDVQIKDRFVSRRHLKITKRKGQYYLKDLQSKNGTFINGNQLSPGIEFEIQEGVPIVIGMSLLSLGEGLSEDILSFLDLKKLSEELRQSETKQKVGRPGSLHKNMELIYRVSEIIFQSANPKHTFEKVLDCILNYLKRIDRSAIFLINEETSKTSEVITRFRKKSDHEISWYNQDIIDHVIRDSRPVIFTNIYDESEKDQAETLKVMKVGSLMCTPLIGRTKTLGAIYIDSIEKPYGFRQEDLSLLTAVSNSMAIALENKSLH